MLYVWQHVVQCMLLETNFRDMQAVQKILLKKHIKGSNFIIKVTNKKKYQD